MQRQQSFLFDPTPLPCSAFPTSSCWGKGKNLPGVLNNLSLGTWNCIVFGGLIPPISSSSLSLSHTPLSFPLPCPRAGVRTLTPGTRRRGDSKISACSSGASTKGLLSSSSAAAAAAAPFLRMLRTGVSFRAVPGGGRRGWVCGVACSRQFLSRMRCSRTSFAGVRALWRVGEGEASWARGVEGRVDVEGSSLWARVRFRDS